jgi:hypothetical protein
MRRGRALSRCVLLCLLCTISVVQAQEKKVRSHIDEGHGFVLAYPAEYALKTVGAGGDFSIEGRDGSSVLTGQIEELAGYPRGTYVHSRDVFLDFAVDRAVLRCGADGPDGSAYCKAVYSITHFENPRGLRVLKLLLEHVQVVYSDPPETTETVVGPVYAVDISRPGYVAFLMVGAAPYEVLSGARIRLAEDLIGGLSLLPDSRFLPRPVRPGAVDTGSGR